MADDAGGVGLYAYDATRYASATLRLEERCKLFGEEALRALEQRRHKQECARRQAEALLGPSPAGWAAAETGAAAESRTLGYLQPLRHEVVESGYTPNRQPLRSEGRLSTHSHSVSRDPSSYPKIQHMLSCSTSP